MAAEQIRILRCDQCRTMEELPDFEGNPNEDHVLAALIRQRHTEESGLTHLGQLMKVDKASWDSPSVRKEILRQLAVKTTGFDPETYKADAGFREDAMDCWKQHLRVPECADYKSPDKRLTPNTAKERKEAGLPKYRSEKDVFLCDFCPAKSVVQQKVFKQRGLYN